MERGLSISGVLPVGFDNQVIISAISRPGAHPRRALPFEEMDARSIALLVAALAGEEVPLVSIVECPLGERDSV